jgi:signal transduction histidine kinase
MLRLLQITWSARYWMRIGRSACPGLAAAVLLLTGVGDAAAERKRVMFLHSAGTEFGPWSEYAKAIRTELRRQAPWPVDSIDHSLLSARSRDEKPEIAFIQYLRALYADRPFDLIITLGAPAVGFVQRYRDQLFLGTPVLFAAVEQRRIQYSGLTENDAVVTHVHDFSAFFESILRVLPDTKTLAVVNGTSGLERFWDGEIRREAKAFENRITFKWYNDLSFADILKDAAALPPHSAIFWELMMVDAAGVVHEGDAALKRLHSVANAPIFAYQGAFFGPEIVGGPMHSPTNTGLRVVNTAIRILQGEKAGTIKVPVTGFATAKYNWREMQRWGISESRLPPGSEIHFRAPTLWDRYSTEVLVVGAALLFQAALIFWLIYEHRRRHFAEVASQTSRAELAHVNRRATVSELSVSIAHEVNQPLAAIGVYAHAASNWLKPDRINIEQANKALDQIMSASLRAGEIIHNLRAMFKKESRETAPVDVNRVIVAVVALVRMEAQIHDVEIRGQLEDRLPPVLGVELQLQQVILNLVMNAIEAMHSTSGPRELTVRSELSAPNEVRVSVEDTGHGIPASELQRIFHPMFTTKANGMGMGLAICQSIIERHDGRIWVVAGSKRGSTFQFVLPPCKPVL